MRPLASLLGIFCMLPCSTQAGQSSGDAGPALQRLELTLLAELEVIQPHVPAAQSWRPLTHESITQDWNFGETRHEVLPNGENEVLAIFREKPVRIEIPLQMTFHDTPRLQLDLVVRGAGTSLTASLMQAGQVVRTNTVRLKLAQKTQEVDVYFPVIGNEALACDRLLLEFPEGRLPIGLEGLTLEDLVIGGAPAVEAFRGLALVEVGSDARRSHCFSNGAGLSTRFTVADARQQLTFAFAIPKSLRRAGPTPVLKVTLRSEGLPPAEHSLEFSEGRIAWKRTTLKLTAYAGREVNATFELASDSDCFAVLSQPQLLRSVEKPASVLLITSGSHRADHLGFTSSNGVPQTPFLDSLAAQGVSFSDVSVSSNGSSASLIALLSGRSAAESGIVGAHQPLPPTALTLAECFASLGYRTLAAVSSADVGFARCGLGRGFDRYSNPIVRPARNSSATIGRLQTWLQDAREQPLFVWLHISDAEGPFGPPADIIRLYYPDELNPYDLASPIACPQRAPAWDPMIADPWYTEALYDAEVTRLDRALGKLLETERFARATIAFTADHGQTLRRGGEARFSHRGLSGSNLAVPLIFRAPRLQQPARKDGPLRQIDVGRSLLNLAGHGEQQFPGNDLFSAGAEREQGRYSVQEGGRNAALQVGPWLARIALNPLQQASAKSHDFQLFNLERDANCQSDLRSGELERSAQMQRQLLEWLRQNGPGDGSWIDPKCDCKSCQTIE